MANKLYYGNGNCAIEGSDVRGVEIRYRGAIEIDDKTSDSFVLMAQNNGIIVSPIGEGTLNDLFDYKGEFKIISVKAVDTNAEFLPVTIDAQTDYTELSSTNPEDSTINIEDLDSTYTVSGCQ